MVYVKSPCPKCGKKRTIAVYAYQSEKYTQCQTCGTTYLVTKPPKESTDV